MEGKKFAGCIACLALLAALFGVSSGWACDLNAAAPARAGYGVALILVDDVGALQALQTEIQIEELQISQAEDQ